MLNFKIKGCQNPPFRRPCSQAGIYVRTKARNWLIVLVPRMFAAWTPRATSAGVVFTRFSLLDHVTSWFSARSRHPVARALDAFTASENISATMLLQSFAAWVESGSVFAWNALWLILFPIKQTFRCESSRDGVRYRMKAFAMPGKEPKS